MQAVFKNEKGLEVLDAVLRYSGEGRAILDGLMDVFEKGLGKNRALLVDLNGEFPALPKLPKEFADHGKLPRLSLFADVKDRQAVGKAGFRLGL